MGDGVLEAGAVEVLAAGLAVGDGPAAQPHQLARRGRGHGRHQESLAPGASYVSFVDSCYHEKTRQQWRRTYSAFSKYTFLYSLTV